MSRLVVPADDDWLLTDDQLALLNDAELSSYLDALQVLERGADGEWDLLPRQQTAEDVCTALMAAGDVFELLYGGAGGGGKSEWLLWHQYHLCLKYPGSRHLLLRRSFPELNRTAILRSLMRFDRDLAKYHVNEKIWEFDNGSALEFGYLEVDRDVFQYDSAEYASVAFDELTQHPTDFPYRYLFSRLRVSMRQSIAGLTPHMVSGTNPHRVGAAWVKARFVDLGPPEEVHEVHIDVGDENFTERRSMFRVFIPAKLADNRHIDASAYRQGLANLDESTRKAIEDGSWDVIEGQYFDEWNRELHVVKPFAIPRWWRLASGYDFGIANPMCHLWGAFDGDGHCVIYRELYGPEMILDEQAGRIKRLEGQQEHLDYRVADPSIWTRTGAGPPIAQQFTDLGLRPPFRKANNARIDGWARLRSYLKINPGRPHLQRVDDAGQPAMGAPSLYIFSTCPNLIRTLPMLVHDERNPEDLDTRGEDHAGDALRYLLMSRPLRTHEPKINRDLKNRTERRHVARSARSTAEHPIIGTIER